MKAKKILLTTLGVIMVCLLAIGLFFGGGTEEVAAGGTPVPITDNIKDYDAETKTVNLKYKDGKDIASVELLTPLMNRVKIGNTRFAEYKVIGKTDLEESFFGEIVAYDKNDYDKKGKDATKIFKEIELKYKTYETYLVDKYSCSSTISANGTLESICVIDGEKEELREVWLPYDKKTKIEKDEELIIGLYTETKQGEYIEWIPTFEGVEVDEWATYITSGAETTDGAFTVVTFTEDGYFNVSGGSIEAEVLVVAGGGGGGNNIAGGAGGGGVVTHGSKTITEQGHSITIGAGGASGVSAGDRGSDGGDSVFMDITAVGGGGGGGATTEAGANGGSGGGGSESGSGGTGTQGASGGGTGFGNDGGNGLSSSPHFLGGGGGGANAAGVNADSSSAGDGGEGLDSSISGSSEIYGSGGGGGWLDVTPSGDAGTRGDGGTNAGSGGVSSSTSIIFSSSSATDGFGGGGGGGGWESGSNNAGGNGGSGIVIIRFLTPVICTFSGFVLDEQGNAIVGANVTITNQHDQSEFYENTTIAGGAWSIDILNSTKIFEGSAQINNTVVGFRKGFISGSC